MSRSHVKNRILVGVKDSHNRPRFERVALEEEITRQYRERMPEVEVSVHLGRSSFLAVNTPNEQHIEKATLIRKQIEEDLDAIGEKQSTSLEQ